MSTLTQLELVSLTARLSKERADYATKQLLAQSDQEKAIYAIHVKTLDALLVNLAIAG